MNIAKRRWCALIAVLLLLSGCYWIYGRYRAKQNLAKVEALARELAPEQARKLPEQQRRELFKQLQTAMRQLSPAQRGQMFQMQRQKRTEEMKRVLQLPKRQQLAHLDKEIKQSEERRRRFEQMQKANGGMRPGGGPPGFPRGNGRSPPTDPAQREQRAKQRLDRSTAEERAVSSEYRKLLNDRRAQLGLPQSPGRR